MARSYKSLCITAFFSLSLQAQTPSAKPLTALPYSPSLDVTSMDKSADPCVNFYQYACGNWIKKNPIPPDQARWDVYSKLYQDNQQYLWGLLEQAAQPRPDRSKVEQEIGDYFHACMDEGAIESAGAKPIERALKDISALKDLKELTNFVARQSIRNRGLLFGFGANQDYADSSRVIAFIQAGGLGLPDRDYYTNTDDKSVEARAKYVEHVHRMLALAGLDGTKAGDILQIETALAKASLTRVQRRDPYKVFHKMSRAQLIALAPSFDWDSYLAAYGLPHVDEFNVSQPDFVSVLDVELRVEPLDHWKSYLAWHVINAEAPYLSSKFVQEDFDFNSKYLRGTPQLQPRWRRCVRNVDRDLGESLGQVFVQKTFGPQAKQQAQVITDGIEAAMEQDLKDLPWMSDPTKQQAIIKLHGIMNKIGYPNQWRDYSSIRLDRSDFLGNVMRSTEFETRRNIAKIGKPVDRGEWGMTPPTVNAYYSPQMNTINFPAGVLQPPVFDMRMDDAPNYGDTGATIGHELTHGFDDQGRQFDAKGNLHDWWTPADSKAFNDRAQCIVDQYAQYTIIDDIKINSRLTLGEDIADLGGTYLAYVAWQKAQKGKQLKPIDDFTPEQRFFIGNAQWACGDERPENKRVGAMTDPHSPDEYRVNGVMTNLSQFGEAFGCKLGQPMARENACRIW